MAYVVEAGTPIQLPIEDSVNVIHAALVPIQQLSKPTSEVCLRTPTHPHHQADHHVLAMMPHSSSLLGLTASERSRKGGTLWSNGRLVPMMLNARPYGIREKQKRVSCDAE
jgi:hypothetical protein